MAGVAPSLPVSAVEIGKYGPSSGGSTTAPPEIAVPPLKAQPHPLPRSTACSATIGLEHRLPMEVRFQTRDGS